MELRTLLYGYNKHQFRFYLNETESSVVKQIFDDYISGLTLQKIADRLTAEKIIYYKDKATWNKHMVRRILENRHYAGDEEYPAIVTPAVFEQANEKRLKKGGDRETDSEQEKYFKSHTVCEQCGGRFTRRRNWSQTREKWYCTCGLSIAAVLYPPVSESISRWRQEEIMIAAAKQITAAPDEKLTAEYAAAEEYNRCLLSGGQLSSYTNLLNLSGDGIMGVLEIPKIDVTLPIYHGTDNTTLSKGIGHLYGTSLPVGGKGTHAALSGHSGMAGQRMLSDLDQLVIGDCFTLRVLGKNLTYQADQIKIVLPENVSDLAIDPEKDYVTLVTCTPYGVNTHRLLVRGVRVAEQEMPVYNKAPSTWYRQYGYGILAGLIAAVLLLCSIILVRHICIKKYKK